jgi:hypothetical protein
MNVFFQITFSATILTVNIILYKPHNKNRTRIIALEF